MSGKNKSICDTCGAATKTENYRPPGFGTTPTTISVCTFDRLHGVELPPVTAFDLRVAMNKIAHAKANNNLNGQYTEAVKCLLRLIERADVAAYQEFVSWCNLTAADNVEKALMGKGFI